MGDSGVGKTALLRRATDNSYDFTQTHLPTVVVDFKTKVAHLRDRLQDFNSSMGASNGQQDAAPVKSIKMQIW